MDGLVWKQDCKKEPIAYGVHKLIVGCVIEDEKISVDDLQEKIMEFEEEVQSVDIAVFNKI
jgi:translation elongation factor EF-1beta